MSVAEKNVYVSKVIGSLKIGLLRNPQVVLLVQGVDLAKVDMETALMRSTKLYSNFARQIVDFDYFFV